MTKMRDTLLWMKLQQDKPEFRAFSEWQNRNQTPIPLVEKTTDEELEVVEETIIDKD